MLLLSGGKMLPRMEASHFRAGPEQHGENKRRSDPRASPRKAGRVGGFTQ